MTALRRHRRLPSLTSMIALVLQLVALAINRSADEPASERPVAVTVENRGRRRFEALEIRTRSLTFTFGGRRVVAVKIRGDLSSQDAMFRILGEDGIQVADSSVMLPLVHMDRGDSFQVLVLLSGAGKGVTGACDFTPGGPGSVPLSSSLLAPASYEPAAIPAVAAANAASSA